MGTPISGTRPHVLVLLVFQRPGPKSARGVFLNSTSLAVSSALCANVVPSVQELFGSAFAGLFAKMQMTKLVDAHCFNGGCYNNWSWHEMYNGFNTPHEANSGLGYGAWANTGSVNSMRKV